MCLIEVQAVTTRVQGLVSFPLPPARWKNFGVAQRSHEVKRFKNCFELSVFSLEFQIQSSCQQCLLFNTDWKKWIPTFNTLRLGGGNEDFSMIAFTSVCLAVSGYRLAVSGYRRNMEKQHASTHSHVSVNINITPLWESETSHTIKGRLLPRCPWAR